MIIRLDHRETNSLTAALDLSGPDFLRAFLWLRRVVRPASVFSRLSSEGPPP